jgi:hypothetical protein
MHHQVLYTNQHCMKRVIFAFYLVTVTFYLRAQQDCIGKPTESFIMAALRDKPVSDIDICWFCIGYNVTDSVKQRLLYLLKPEWTANEVAGYLDRYMLLNGFNAEVDSIAKAMSNTDTKFHQIKDSLTKRYKTNALENLKANNYFGVSSKLIEAVALLDLKQAMPILKSAQKDTTGRYHLPTVEKAMARLGDKAMQRKIIKECAANKMLDYDEWRYDFSDKFMRLYFVGTQESIYATSAFLDTTKHYTYTSKVDGKAAYLVIGFLNEIILNKDFRVITNGIDLKGVTNVSNAFVMKCKSWLLKNKGRYVLKPFCAKVKR